MATTDFSFDAIASYRSNKKFIASFNIKDGEEKHISSIVNLAYERGEKGMWKIKGRTNPDEIKNFCNNNNIIVIKENDTIVGSIYVTSSFNSNSNLGELGMLAVHEDYLGQGVGSLLIKCAEEFCKKSNCKQIRLELLAPKDYVHPFKHRLDQWYTKLKYVKGKTEDFMAAFPQIAPNLAVPCNFTVYIKDLL
eukprot:g9522.t1